MKFRVFKTSDMYISYASQPANATDMEFNTLEELMEFVGSASGRCYRAGTKKELPLEVILYKKDGVNYIEIYDDYRE